MKQSKKVQRSVTKLKKELQKLLKLQRKVAQEEGDRIITGARAEIDQELNRAKEELRAQVSTLALAGAEKILDKEIDKKAHAAMLAKLAKDL